MNFDPLDGVPEMLYDWRQVSGGLGKKYIGVRECGAGIGKKQRLHLTDLQGVHGESGEKLKFGSGRAI
jgi:hypothetical protein